MADRRWLLLVLIGLAAFIAAQCGGPPAPSISSIRSDPNIAKEGGIVVYTIPYNNTSQDNSFSDTVVVVRYHKYLSFNQKSIPFPDEVDEGQRELRWELGTLGPGEGGSIEVEFTLAPKIPLAVYELNITAEISSTDPDGNRIQRQGTERTLIEGHPTPTPTATNTPEPTVPPTNTPTPGVTSVVTPIPATTVPSPEDCLPYNPDNLGIVDEGVSGWLLTDGVSRMLILDNEADARNALTLAKGYTAQCFIGRGNTRTNRIDYIVEYWKGDSGLTTAIVPEDCLPYNPDNLGIVDEGVSGWLLTDGVSRMLILDNEADARNALTLAKGYTAQCFIGRDNTRPNRKDYIVEYWK